MQLEKMSFTIKSVRVSLLVNGMDTFETNWLHVFYLHSSETLAEILLFEVSASFHSNQNAPMPREAAVNSILKL